LAWPVKDTGECLIGKIGAEHVESALYPRIDQSSFQRQSKRFRPVGPAAERLRHCPDETGISLGCLNLDTHEPARRGTAAVSAGRFSLGLARHNGFSALLKISGNMTGTWNDSNGYRTEDCKASAFAAGSASARR
jgi:hypothetical protein